MRQQPGVAVGAAVVAVAGGDGAPGSPAVEPSPPATVKALAEKRPLWSSEPPVRLLRQGVSPYGSMPWRSAIASICSGVSPAAMARRRPLQRLVRAPLRPSSTLNSRSIRSTDSGVSFPLMSNSGCAR